MVFDILFLGNLDFTFTDQFRPILTRMRLVRIILASLFPSPAAPPHTPYLNCPARA